MSLPDECWDHIQGAGIGKASLSESPPRSPITGMELASKGTTAGLEDREGHQYVCGVHHLGNASRRMKARRKRRVSSSPSPSSFLPRALSREPRAPSCGCELLCCSLSLPAQHSYPISSLAVGVSSPPVFPSLPPCTQLCRRKVCLGCSQGHAKQNIKGYTAGNNLL